ncbi:MAG: chitobiase/beta-hexosaminidase C-terminal domain-containing protein, partial [Tannerellaceae bacterium]|nr:chitobiase/beta-hexosaminidase C-terminal domain-containing protein [Tannerellaceae bacterium]
ELLNRHETKSPTLETAKLSAEYILEKKPNFLFIQLDEVDGHGHRDGHMSPGYIRSIEEADSWVRIIVDAIREAGIADRTMIMIVSDHGGLYHSHGDAAWEEVTVPVIFSGAGIKKNCQIRQQMYVFDMAANVAFALGLDIPYEWTGRPTTGAFAGFDEPDNQWDGIELLPAPAFPIEDKPHGKLFVDEPAEVVIKQPGGTEGVIRYTTDGSVPTRESTAYTAPFILDHSAVINAKLFGPKGESANVIAYYRVADSKAGHGLNFKLYRQPVMKEMPAFESLQPAGAGTCYEFSLSSPEIQALRANYGHNYAMTFTGRLQIDTDGMYTFRLFSEDGSKLYIGQDLVVNKSGLGESLSTGKIELKAGFYPVRMEYFKNGGGGEITLYYEGPGIPNQILPANKLFKQ